MTKLFGTRASSFYSLCIFNDTGTKRDLFKIIFIIIFYFKPIIKYIN